MRATLYQSMNAANSVHVVGRLTYPGLRLRVNVGMQSSGDMAGLVVDNGMPTVVVDSAGKMYPKATRAFLASIHSSAACATLCGKYMLAPRKWKSVLLRLMSPDWIFPELLQLAQRVTHLSATTYHGQPALSAVARTYGQRIDVLLSATPQRYPLRISDRGAWVLMFSKWNAVPTPVAPPQAQIVTLPG